MKYRSLKIGRRGAALEAAIMFMLIISLVCMLALTLSVILNSQNKLIERKTASYLDLYAIGDEFVLTGSVSSPKEGSLYECRVYDTYDESADITVHTLLVTRVSDGSGILKITVDESQNILEWTQP